jgi:cell fate (sporulation/competence/biofilm development) regulator YlbF (YheA/YmcA/DUF963 family)
VAAKAKSLADAMKGSREYQEYLAAYNKMSQEEVEKLRSFKQTESQTPPQGHLSYDEEKRISHLYTVLTLNQNIKEFMEKERAVCTMLTQVFEEIGDIHLFMFE